MNAIVEVGVFNLESPTCSYISYKWRKIFNLCVETSSQWRCILILSRSILIVKYLIGLKGYKLRLLVKLIFQSDIGAERSWVWTPEPIAYSLEAGSFCLNHILIHYSQQIWFGWWPGSIKNHVSMCYM